MKLCCFTSMIAVFLLLCSSEIQAQTKQPKTNKVQMRNYEGLKLVPQIFEGETHISVYPIALTNGLKTIYKR